MTTTPKLLSRADRDALSRCLALARTLRPELYGQPVSPSDPKLWIATAMAASYSCQIASLQLRPWEWPPCWLETDADIAAALKLPAGDHTQQRRAAKIVTRLLTLGLSRYEPNPLEAIESAEANVEGNADDRAAVRDRRVI
jgi:hypothetical protein